MTRRDMIKRAEIAGAALLAAPMINRGRYRLFAYSTTAYSASAKANLDGVNTRGLLVEG